MAKISFKNDYSEGAHPKILERLLTTNLVQQEGYGNDEYCEQAQHLIKDKINNPDAEVYFTSGGTQANSLVVSHLLLPYESVIAAETAHIAVHETGAIENTGHKINTVRSIDGKIYPEQIRFVLDLHADEHMVKPAMVYISNTTELGTVYTKSELTELSAFCRKNELLLFMDGARLGMALTSKQNDMTLADIARLVDVFCIGGTKNGALLGEAIVFVRQGLDKDFKYSLKQKGALLAKGRVLGIQFLSLFEEDLYFELAIHANTMANEISEAFQREGYDFFVLPQSNQIYPILPDSFIKELNEKFDFYVWSKIDESHSSIRIVCSWATKERDVKLLIKSISQYQG